MVWWATVSPGWSGEHQLHLVVLGDLVGQVNILVICLTGLVKLTSMLMIWSGEQLFFPPDWPSWLSEQQCHLFGLLGLIGQVNININWLAGWHGWMTFNLLGWVTWSSHLGWQEILCHRGTLLSTGWLGWSTSLLMIWSGEQLHLVGLSKAGWTSLSEVWSGGQQLYMVDQVSTIINGMVG